MSIQIEERYAMQPSKNTWLCWTSLSVVGLASFGHGQDPLYEIKGSLAGEDIGEFLLGPGDIDGDGFGDFVVVASTGSVQQMRARSGANGAILWMKELGELPSGEWVTSSAALTGDLDGDGIPDVVIGCQNCWKVGVSQGIFAGRVRTYSGATGAKLWEAVGEEANLFFGTSVAGMDDINADGVEDVAVGAWSDEPESPAQGNVGSVRMLSGVDGTETYRIYGPAYASSGSGGPGMGGTLGRLGDLDADGIDDFGVGPYVGLADSETGEIKSPVWIVSGLDGSLVTELNLPTYANGLLAAFANPGDLTGDGLPEVVAGFKHSTNPGIGSTGVAVLYEGGSWTMLAEWQADLQFEFFGGTLAIPGDADGDGYTDVLVGTRWTNGPANPPYGVVRLYSGRTYEELFEILGDVPDPPQLYTGMFGRALAPLGDVNGDGAPDFVTGMQWAENLFDQGLVRAYSTRPLTLSTKAPWITAAGGVQRLNVELGAAHAGELYLVLGSATGIEPQVPLGPLSLPLVPDAYTSWVLASGGGPMGGDFLGLLDVNGHALVKVTVPPLSGPLASLVGSLLWHAALTIAPTGIVSATTNAVPLTLVP
ncbi:MAG TPA: integrin alpha [Planctomycetota bacterium]|nr:integrin alpha [Planctomycetota bacterium]